jgi:hypothetical protein
VAQALIDVYLKRRQRSVNLLHFANNLALPPKKLLQWRREIGIKIRGIVRHGIGIWRARESKLKAAKTERQRGSGTSLDSISLYQGFNPKLKAAAGKSAKAYA